MTCPSSRLLAGVVGYGIERLVCLVLGAMVHSCAVNRSY